MMIRSLGWCQSSLNDSGLHIKVNTTLGFSSTFTCKRLCAGKWVLRVIHRILGYETVFQYGLDHLVMIRDENKARS